jgi:hypothetical protein
LEPLRLLEFLEILLVGVLIFVVLVILVRIFILILIFHIIIFLEIDFVLMLLVHFFGGLAGFRYVQVFFVFFFFSWLRLHRWVNLLNRQNHSGVESVVEEIMLQSLFFVLLIGHRRLLNPHLGAEGECSLLTGDAGGGATFHLEGMLEQNFSFVTTEAMLSFEVEGDTGHVFLVAVNEFEAG